MTKNTTHNIPTLPGNLQNCLECFKNQILRMEFTTERSYLVDAIDYVLEETTKEEGTASNE